MRTLLLTLGLFALLGAPSAFCDEGPTISGGDGDARTPRDIPEMQCRIFVRGGAPLQADREKPRTPGDEANIEESCPGAQIP